MPQPREPPRFIKCASCAHVVARSASQLERHFARERRLVGAIHLAEAALAQFLADFERAGAWSRSALGELKAPGEGKTEEGTFGLTPVPKDAVDVHARLEGLGRLIDAMATARGPAASPLLIAATDKRGEAIKAWSERDFSSATARLDEAAQVLMGVVPERSGEVAALWELEKLLGVAQARAEALNWTKPMLSMNEQLTLVLVLELAFGLIFELPLVMAVLGLTGLVSSKFLFKYQRHAFVVCLIAAAVLTPTGDAVNLALMAVPMLLCYELGVVLVWLVEKRRARAPEVAIPPTQ